jgi:hypothetical protein
MEVISMLSPADRCVRAKMQLFLRLWIARQKYEGLRPFGSTTAQRLRFHLTRLEECWSRVVAFQKALGLDIVLFAPHDQFELIYLISAFVERELRQADCAVLDATDKWRAYQSALNKLSHDLNPYDFAEISLRCCTVIQTLNSPVVEPAEIIPMERAHLAHFQQGYQGMAF